MDETSTNLKLPYLQAAQAQKHVTHNAALERLDLIVQLVLQSFAETVPPLAPDEGQVWAIGSGAVNDWVGHDNELAGWSNGGWVFVAPQPGWCAALGGEIRVWDGAAWVAADLPDLQGLPGVGVNTSYDGTNKLAVASAATLFTHVGNGHQLKVNKNATGDTASLLFQTGWSGRAEMGLAGGDDFSVKVSADGSSWFTAMSAAGSSGVVALLSGLTIDGKLAYHRGNILGSVSQAAGVPTGAALERGSNANGRYLRLADGTQLCWYAYTSDSVTTYGSGTFASPYSAPAVTWTFPAVFSVAPQVLAQTDTGATIGAARRLTATIGTVTTTACANVAVARFSGDATASTPTVHLFAVGRWF